MGRNMFLPDSDTLFYALPCKNMMLFPCVNLMSFYAFGNQVVKPCCNTFQESASPSFFTSMQKVAFYRLKANLLQRKRPPFSS